MLSDVPAARAVSAAKIGQNTRICARYGSIRRDTSVKQNGGSGALGAGSMRLAKGRGRVRVAVCSLTRLGSFSAQRTPDYAAGGS